MNENPHRRFTGPELCGREAYKIVDLLRRREVSPQDLLAASRARVEAVEPAVNAIVTTCWERAGAAAATPLGSDPAHPGWLGGLPIGIKDLTPVAGVRSTFGTMGLEHFVPDQSDVLVERLEARGGLVVGKTNTPEFGAGGNTFNAVFGATRNARDTRLNAGGSSGGAAVSLATGELWLSHGSDHGGSLRTPASYNAVVGLRPSPGVAPSDAEAAFLTEGQQGPMARSVRDCALFLDAMAGFEPSVPSSWPAPATPYQQAVIEADGKVRIGYAPDLGGLLAVEPVIATVLGEVLGAVERGGGRVDEATPDLDGLERTYHQLRGQLWAAAFHTAPETLTRHFKATLRENLAFGRALTLGDTIEANITRTRLYAEMVAFFRRFDVLACPVTGSMPRPVEEEWVHRIEGETLWGYMDWLRFAFLATTTGLPAISVPAGFGPGGIPIGMQLIAPPRGEARLLAVARAVEIAAGGPFGPIDPVVTHR